jgi:predicted GNAT family acetyltransferase
MSLQIQNDEKERKFYALVEGQEAVIGYAKVGDVYNLMHTFVPEDQRGHGVAEELVRGTLDQIAAEGAKFLPTCPYVQAFVKKHPEYEKGIGHLG